MKWPLSENMCMLHVLYNGLDSAGIELMTCGGTFEPRALLKSVMMKDAGRTLLWGASSEDAHKLLGKIVENNKAIGKTVEYTWKKVGYNRNTSKRWCVDHSRKSCLAKKGIFVIFGKAKWENEKHKAWIKRLRKLERAGEEDEIERLYSEVADGSSPVDHAVGIKVNEDLSATLICNGCVKGAKKFSMVNLADRMEDVCIYYEYGLVEV